MISTQMPVVLGSSLTGLLISLALSKRGIQHTLIGGDPPNDEPRLGESLNECASPGLWLDFGERHRDCFHTKNHISLFTGDRASLIYIADPRKCTHRADGMLSSGKRSIWPVFRAAMTGRSLMHIDRTKFDPRVYEEAIARPECQFLKKLVSSVELRDDDRVQCIQMDDGTEIHDPSYVFDTLGFRSPVCRAAKLKTEALSSRQRVVWAHYHTQETNANTAASQQEQRSQQAQRSQQPWWSQGTNLVRLDQQRDGLEGISWMIPLGDTISVGISVDNQRCDAANLTMEHIRENIDAAFARRGMDYRQRFPVQSKATKEIVHAYYKRQRAYGANWLLAGGSYISIWFPSSAGLWTSIAACRMVEQLIADPLKAGAEYEAMMTQPLLQFHEHLGNMIEGPVFQNNRELFLFWSKWMAGIPHRLADYFQLESNQKQRFDWMKRISQRMQRDPIMQLMFWGFPTIRTRRPSALSQQADSIRGYYRRSSFYMTNHLLSPLQFLGLRR